MARLGKLMTAVSSTAGHHRQRRTVELPALHSQTTSLCASGLPKVQPWNYNESNRCLVRFLTAPYSLCPHDHLHAVREVALDQFGFRTALVATHWSTKKKGRHSIRDGPKKNVTPFPGASKLAAPFPWGQRCRSFTAPSKDTENVETVDDRGGPWCRWASIHLRCDGNDAERG